MFLYCICLLHVDSVISLSEEDRLALHAEIAKNVKSIPETPLDDAWAAANIQVPSEIRIGDNPYFDVYKKARSEGKLD